MSAMEHNGLAADIERAACRKHGFRPFRMLAFTFALLAALALAGCGASGSQQSPAEQAGEQEVQPSASAPTTLPAGFDPTGWWRVWSAETSTGNAYHIDRVEEAAGLGYGELHADYLFGEDGAVSAIVNEENYDGEFVIENGTIKMQFPKGEPIVLMYDAETEMLVYVDDASGSKTYLKKDSTDEEED